MPHDLVPFHPLIAEAHGVAALGLGGKKGCCDRAAYLSHATYARHLEQTYDVAVLFATDKI